MIEFLFGIIILNLIGWILARRELQRIKEKLSESHEVTKELYKELVKKTKAMADYPDYRKT